MHIESGWIPVRIRSMTARTVNRKSQCTMVRIGGLIKIYLVALGALGGSTLITRNVTLNAICANMGPSQWEVCEIVIKGAHLDVEQLNSFRRRPK